MKTMRESYELYLQLYGTAIERGSLSDALLRGAFSAGVVHGLGMAKLSRGKAMTALEQMSREIEAFWHKEPKS